MNKSMNRLALIAVLTGAGLYRDAEVGSDGSGQAPAAPKVELTKDEKLAKIKEQIAKLEQRYDDILNDRQPAPKAKKEAYVPEAGAKVLATVGRTTATTQAKVVEGTVLGVKFPAEGEKGAAQVRVRIYEGTFDEQAVTLYLSAIEKFVPAAIPVDEFGNEVQA